MRFNPILVIAALLFTASVVFGQNDPSYYRINGTDAYVNPNLGGYADGGYGNGGFFGDGYNNRISPKAQNILAIGQTAFMVGSLFKKSPQEAQAKAALEIERIRANSPVNLALAGKIQYEAVSKARLTAAETSRMYSGATVSDDDQVTSDGGTHRVMNVTGGQVVSSMSLSPDYDAYEAPRQSGRHRTVSMRNRGRRRQVEESDDLTALIRERHDRRSDQSERATKISVSTPDDEPEAPKPPKKRHRRVKKTVETTVTITPVEQGGPSFGGRERPPWITEE